MLTGTELASDERAENKGRRISGRTSAKLWAAAGLAGIVFVGVWLKYSPGASGSSAGAPGEIRDGLRVIRSGLAPNDRVIVETKTNYGQGNDQGT